MDFGHLGHTIKSGLAGAASDQVGGLWAGTPGLTGAGPRSRGASSASGRNGGAGGEAKPQGSSCGGASGKGAPGRRPLAYTRSSGCTGKRRASATRSEEAGDKALDRFW